MLVITPVGYAESYKKSKKFWKYPVFLRDNDSPWDYIANWWLHKSPFSSDFYTVAFSMNGPNQLEQYKKYRNEHETITEVINCRYIHFIVSKVENEH